ncbi:MAG: J domain-containing protein [Hyphomicrobiales bacterium]|nr:J domain-containing protein [Hyphomicrobiales bacterium]
MAAADPYDLLGVARDASQKDIQKAYRRLAKQVHPDLNPGDKEAQSKFQALNAAYDILGDEDKRARFDRGEIDATGAETPQRRYYRDFAQAGEASPRYETESGFTDFSDADDIFAAFSRGRGRFRLRGADRRYHLEVDFLDAVNGASRRVTLPDGAALDVVIPPGVRDGQMLRLAGEGEPGVEGGEPGDALVEIAVRPHPFFKREGDDITLELPITLPEAVLGGKVTVPTPTGAVEVTIPKGSNSGKVLRLRGKGVRRRDGTHGDERLTLRVTLPESPDPELEAFASQWAAGRSYDPRRRMGM